MNKIIIAVIVVLVAVGGWMIATGGNTPTQQEPVASAYPEPTNYVVDTVGLLSAQDLAALNSKLKTLDDGKKQFAVAIVKTTSPLSMPAYAIKLAEKWKVGYAGLDNGAILIIAVDDRQVRIEVGKGLEGDINDAKAGKILDDYAVPYLKDSDFFGAINSTIDELNTIIK